MVKRLISSGKKLLTEKQESLLSAAAIMIFLTIITKLVGFWKVHLIARFFGSGRELDIFWAASTIPDMLYGVIMVGALNSALIPALSAKLAKEGEQKLWQIYNWVQNFLILVFLGFGIIAFIFARPFSELMINLGATQTTTPFTSSEIDLMANLLRLLLLSPLFLGISSIQESLLNVYERFVLPTLGPLFQNLVMIVGLFLFVNGFGWGVNGLGLSVILGTIVQVLILIPLLKHLKVPFIAEINWKSKELWQIIGRSIPRVVGIAGDQVAVAVDRVIALGLVQGSLSSFSYALNLYVLPVQVFGASIGKATNPRLAREYAKGDIKSFKKILLDSLQLSFFLGVPCLIFLVVLRIPLVRMVLGAGAFNWFATLTTGWVLAFLGLGVIAQIVVAIVARAFYSIHNTVTPVIISLFGSGINILGAYLFTNFFSHFEQPNLGLFFPRGIAFSEWLNYFFTRSNENFAVGGLALATSFAVTIQAALLLYFFNKRIKFITRKSFIQPFLTKLFFGVLSGIVMFVLLKYLDSLGFAGAKLFDSTRVVGVASILLVSGGVGSILYFLLCYYFKVEEVYLVIEMFKAALKKFRS